MPWSLQTGTNGIATDAQICKIAERFERRLIGVISEGKMIEFESEGSGSVAKEESDGIPSYHREIQGVDGNPIKNIKCRK
jgi:hypothetical protein